MTQPIKRHKAIQPLSRDHHQGLLLCWKIREGFKLDTDPQRIKRYTDWYWRTHLKQHFYEEENQVFSILGNENAYVKQALEEHRKLELLFNTHTEVEHTLQQIETTLQGHIRFEERVLFNEIQKAASSEQLASLHLIENPPEKYEEWDDVFWKRSQ